jgi:hypothetical protein
MKTRLGISALVLAAATLPAAASDIYRCASARGVTYQEVPCPDRTIEERANVPTEFPAPNVEERNRLFAREADLYKRLEARRDREVQELVLRDAAAERALERERLAALAALAAQQPLYVLSRWPGRPAGSGIRRSHPTW